MTRTLVRLAIGMCLLAPNPARALEIREGFEWAWAPLCVDPGTQWISCFAVAGCNNGRDLFVRRTNPGVCDYSEQVRFWVGRQANTAAPTPPSVLGDPENRWVASHVNDPSFRKPNGDTFEILTSRAKQSSRAGVMQVDLHIPENVPVTGAGEHYLILHNLNLRGVVPCPADGAACPDTRSNVGGVPGRSDSYQWYGVIAGAFGSGTEAIPYGSVGFAIEVSAQGRGGNHLIDESFLPYSVDGAQEAFPRGTYRVRIARTRIDGDDIYSYSVRRWNERARMWEPLTPDAPREAPAHEVRVPFARLVAPVGYEISPGYIGVTTAWFGAPTAGRGFRHVDWDNLVVDW